MQNGRRGVLYGQAIGDALGLPAEFKSAFTIRKRWPDPLWPTTFEPTVRTGSQWKSGEFSDDTEQALCILDAYLEGVANGQAPDDTIDRVLVAKHFMQWAAYNGRGMGNHTAQCFEHGLFLLDPFAASEDVWEKSGRRAAPNGAVMRTSYVGILRPWDLDWTETVAVEMAKVTHWDPKCVAGAVALSVAIAVLIDTDGDIPEALQQACTRADKYDPKAHTWMLDRTLESLALDEGMDKGDARPPIGFTYKCLGAAFWALRDFQRQPDGDSLGTRFMDVLRVVIRAGGDTDTNAAVAGAMLGAVVGATGIPPHLIAGLVERAGLDRRFERLSVG